MKREGVKNLLFFRKMVFMSKYVKKAEQIKIIKRANRRLKELRAQGFADTEAYKKAAFFVSMAEGKERKSLSTKGTVKDLKERYSVAKSILADSELSVSYQKEQKYHMELMSPKIEKALGTTLSSGNRTSLFNMLNSDDFKKVSELFGSDQVLTAIKESVEEPDTSVAAIRRRLKKFLDSPKTDRAYIEDLEDILNNKKKED